MRRHGWSLGGTVALLALLATSACADGTGDPAAPTPPATARPAPSPASPSASLTAAQVAERDALAAYRGMWEDWVAIAATGDYQNPRLATHASGPALSLIYRGVYANWRDGLVARGEPVLSPKTSAATPPGNSDRITITDCVDSSNWLNYRTDGQLENDTPGGRRFIQALAVQTAGEWKVDQLVV